MNVPLKRDGLSLENCNLIKVCMMFAVVLYHSMALWLRDGWFIVRPAEASPLLDGVASWLNTFHVNVFTFISGYVFFYLKFECGKYKNYLVAVKDRAKRLLIPYLFTAFLWVFPMWFITYRAKNPIEGLKDLVLAEKPQQLWFLWMIFWISVIFIVFGKIIERLHLIIGIVLCLGLYGVSLVGPRLAPNLFQIWVTLGYIIFYYLGFILRKYKDKFKFNNMSTLFFGIGHLVLFLVWHYVIPQENIVLKLVSMGVLMLCKTFGTGMIVSLFAGVNMDKIKKSKLYIILEKYNFGIYLFHQQVIYCVILLLNGKINTPLLLISNFFISFAIAALLTWILSKTKFTRICIGLK